MILLSNSDEIIISIFKIRGLLNSIISPCETRLEETTNFLLMLISVIRSFVNHIYRYRMVDRKISYILFVFFDYIYFYYLEYELIFLF